MCKVKILYSERVIAVSKNLNIGMLLDFYGPMLTEKQREAIDFYYNQDFSLAEIAEEMLISRQGVRDLIKRAEKQLLDFENALGLVDGFSHISKELLQITDFCNEIQSMTKEARVCERAEKIKAVIKNISDKI